MAARKDGLPRANNRFPRADKGKFKKYSSIEEKQKARAEQKREAKKRYRERNREKLREKSKEYRMKNAKVCIQRSLKWQAENKDRTRDAVYKRKYGITLEQYYEMVNERGGRCDICKRELPLVVDHCHETNRVRGLLCDRCNVAIGCFDDDIGRMIAAKEYVAGR